MLNVILALNWVIQNFELLNRYTYSRCSGVRWIFQWGGVSKVTSKICSQFILRQINNLVPVLQNGIKVTQSAMQIKLFKQKTIKRKAYIYT